MPSYVAFFYWNIFFFRLFTLDCIVKLSDIHNVFFLKDLALPFDWQFQTQ